MRTLRNNSSLKNSRLGMMLLVLSLVLIGGSTFAFFTYRLSGTSTLNFGKIQVSDTNSHIVLTKTINNLVPGDNLLNDSETINYTVDSGSQPLYSRVLFKFSVNEESEGNAKIAEYVDTLNSLSLDKWSLVNNTFDSTSYSWKTDDNNYYCLVDSSDKLPSLKANDNVVFANKLIIPTTLTQSTDENGDPVQYGGKIDLTIEIQATQATNFKSVDGSSTEPTMTNVFGSLALKYDTLNEFTFSGSSISNYSGTSSIVNIPSSYSVSKHLNYTQLQSTPSVSPSIKTTSASLNSSTKASLTSVSTNIESYEKKCDTCFKALQDFKYKIGTDGEVKQILKDDSVIMGNFRSVISIGPGVPPFLTMFMASYNNGIKCDNLLELEANIDDAYLVNGEDLISLNSSASSNYIQETDYPISTTINKICVIKDFSYSFTNDGTGIKDVKKGDICIDNGNKITADENNTTSLNFVEFMQNYKYGNRSSLYFVIKSTEDNNRYISFDTSNTNNSSEDNITIIRFIRDYLYNIKTIVALKDFSYSFSNDGTGIKDVKKGNICVDNGNEIIANENNTTSTNFVNFMQKYNYGDKSSLYLVIKSTEGNNRYISFDTNSTHEDIDTINNFDSNYFYNITKIVALQDFSYSFSNDGTGIKDVKKGDICVDNGNEIAADENNTTSTNFVNFMQNYNYDAWTDANSIPYLVTKDAENKNHYISFDTSNTNNSTEDNDTINNFYGNYLFDITNIVALQDFSYSFSNDKTGIKDVKKGDICVDNGNEITPDENNTTSTNFINFMQKYNYGDRSSLYLVIKGSESNYHYISFDTNSIDEDIGNIYNFKTSYIKIIEKEETNNIELIVSPNDFSFSETNNGNIIDVKQGYFCFYDSVRAECISGTSDCTNYKQFIDLVNLGKNPYIVSYDYIYYKGKDNPVTTINSNAFANNLYVTTVNFPTSITKIDSGAFSGCTKIAKIDLSLCNNLTTIGSQVFQNCSSLTEVILPNVITNISDRLFRNCKNLTNISIPNNVQTIGKNAFEDCSSLSGIILPNNISRIGDYSFQNCTNLISVGTTGTDITLSKSTINDENLYQTNIILTVAVVIGPSSETSIGYSAFYGCKSLTNITIPNKIKTISYYSFSGCSNLTSVIIPDGVVTIESNAFSNCSKLTNITLPDSIENIYSNAFTNCVGLNSIRISNNIKTIGNDVFSGCTNLKTFSASDSTANYLGNEINSHLVLYKAINTSITSANINENTKIIYCSAFSDCSKLTSITLPNSIIDIGESAFSSCSGLIGTLVLPNNIKTIRSKAFEFCRGLTNITIPNNVEYIGNDAFFACNGLMGILTIPDSVKSIGQSAFFGCNKLTSIIIGSGLESMGIIVFCSCTSIEDIIVSDSNSYYKSENHCLLTKDGKTLVFGCKNSILPQGLTTIGYCAFSYCTELTNIVIPDTVTTIGIEAFEDCINLKSLVIPSNVKSIGEFAFEDCSSLSNSITIPNGVTSIDRWTFKGCSNLTEIIIPNSVKSIGHYAFSGCGKLTSITIPSSVTSIGYGAFEACVGITSITIPSSVSSISNGAFSNDNNLSNIIIDSGTISQNSTFMGILLSNSITKSIKILSTKVNTTVDNYMITTKGFTKSSTNEIIDSKEYCVYTHS
jgi:hypothetical protein